MKEGFTEGFSLGSADTEGSEVGATDGFIGFIVGLLMIKPPPMPSSVGGRNKGGFEVDVGVGTDVEPIEGSDDGINVGDLVTGDEGTVVGDEVMVNEGAIVGAFKVGLVVGLAIGALDVGLVVGLIVIVVVVMNRFLLSSYLESSEIDLKNKISFLGVPVK